MHTYVLAHDLGTSGNKATLFDEQGRFVKSHVHQYDTQYFNTLCAEQDPEEWWKAVCICTRKILETINPTQIAVIAFSGQMQGCLCVDASGTALHRSMIYCDQRALGETESLIDAIGAQRIYAITGHRPSPSYSLEKLMWVKNHQPEIFKRTRFMLQAKDYLISRLTGCFVTEQNDASGTNALDLSTLTWSDEILDAAEIPKVLLPEVHNSTDIIGRVSNEAAHATGLCAGTPVAAGAGDGGCATIGAGSVSPGATYSYIGSSGWTSTTAIAPLVDHEMRTFSWAHPIRGYYQLCGTMQTAGNCLRWLVEDILGSKNMDENLYEILDKEVASVPAGSKGVIFLPYLMGERTPWWNVKARGCWIGLHQQCDRNTLARAVFEGIAMNLGYTYSIMAESVSINKTRIIGGGARTRSLVQILADVIQMPVEMLKYLEESTSLGAAMIGGVAISMYDSFDQVQSFNPVIESFNPHKELETVYTALNGIFHQAYLQNNLIFNQLFEFVESRNNGVC